MNFEERATDSGGRILRNRARLFLEMPRERMDASCDQWNSNWALGKKFTVRMVTGPGAQEVEGSHSLETSKIWLGEALDNLI